MKNTLSNQIYRSLSKTFLLGEYLALKAGPAIILTEGPSFELRAQRTTHSIKGIHPQSPAGKYISHHDEYFREFELLFNDPHQGRGGFGASTAQFLMVYSLKNQGEFQPTALLDTYQHYAWNGKGFAPSGYDLLAQWRTQSSPSPDGNMTYIEKNTNQIIRTSWPFKELSYFLIPTKNKVATHLHLEENFYFNENSLTTIAYSGWEACLKGDENKLIEAINNYNKLLQQQQLQSNLTVNLLKVIMECPNILASKGCGALGADVILILFKKEFRSEVLNWLKNKKILS